MFSTFNSNSLEDTNDKEEITNNFVYVITYDNFPIRIYNDRENATKFLWKRAREFSDTYSKENEDYTIRLFEEENHIIVTKQYKFFILSYEEIILKLGIFKVDKIDKIDDED